MGTVSDQCWLTCLDKMSKVLDDGISRNNLLSIKATATVIFYKDSLKCFSSRRVDFETLLLNFIGFCVLKKPFWMRVETSPVADYFSTQETNMTWMTNNLHILGLLCQDCSSCVISIFFCPPFSLPPYFCFTQKPFSSFGQPGPHASRRRLGECPDSSPWFVRDSASLNVHHLLCC